MREKSAKDPSPKNVLLDIEEALDDFQVPVGAETLPLGKAVEDRCWDIDAAGKFTVTLIDGTPIGAAISYEKGRGRYRIDSSGLQQIALEAAVAGRRRRTLTAFLNHEQAFRVITGDGSVYARGSYYRPRRPLWGPSSGSDRIALESVLQEDSHLLNISSESFDLTAYTAIISPQLQINDVGSSTAGCTKNGGVFENALPCEGNAAFRPYAALLVGATIGTGNSALGIITVGFTAGVARTGQDANAFAFGGFMVTTGGVFATVPLTQTTTQTVQEIKWASSRALLKFEVAVHLAPRGFSGLLKRGTADEGHCQSSTTKPRDDGAAHVRCDDGCASDAA